MGRAPTLRRSGAATSQRSVGAAASRPVLPATPSVLPATPGLLARTPRGPREPPGTTSEPVAVPLSRRVRRPLGPGLPFRGQEPSTSKDARRPPASGARLSPLTVLTRPRPAFSGAAGPVDPSLPARPPAPHPAPPPAPGPRAPASRAPSVQSTAPARSARPLAPGLG